MARDLPSARVAPSSGKHLGFASPKTVELRKQNIPVRVYMVFEPRRFGWWPGFSESGTLIRHADTADRTHVTEIEEIRGVNTTNGFSVVLKEPRYHESKDI